MSENGEIVLAVEVKNKQLTFNLSEFAPPLLALLGEKGRREFLINVGRILDNYGSTLRDRQAWAKLLDSC